MWREFRAFLVKENVVALAIAVVVGIALNSVVTAVVEDFIMPLIAVVTPAGNWQQATANVGPVAFKVGDFTSKLLNFVIVGFVAWRLSKMFIKPVVPASDASTKQCAYCRMSIDAKASRCPYCTSQMAA